LLSAAVMMLTLGGVLAGFGACRCDTRPIIEC